MIPINLAAEDLLSEAVLRRLLEDSSRSYFVGTCYMHHGFGYLKRTIKGFNNAAKGTPFLVLTDLDTGECPPVLVRDWLPIPRHPNLLFRVAVHEVESWLLADAVGLAQFLRVRAARIPRDVEGIPEPKRFLIQLASGSPNRQFVQDIVPAPGDTSVQGPNYNARLEQFVRESWSPKRAAARSPSLRRTVERIRSFNPIYGLRSGRNR